MTPERTKHPAMAPIRGTRKISLTSASPVTTSTNSGASMPTIACSMSSSSL